MIYYSKNIVTPKGVIEGYLKVKDNKIEDILYDYEGEYIDYENNIIMPGWIDIHIHGWGRGSYMYDKDANSIILMGEDMAKEGVTGFLATTAADSLENTLKYLDGANAVYNEVEINGASLLGVHLEGPFMSKEHRGMQKEEYCIDPDIEFMKTMYEYQKYPDMIKLMAMAPELPHAKEVIKYCNDRNIQISIGHSSADFEHIRDLKEYGIGGVVHMFSGMSGIHHRQPGVAGAALYYDDLYCEFAKQTGITVRHEIFDITYRIKGPDKIIMTTDCAGAAKRKEKSYQYTRKVTYIPQGDTLRLEYDDGRVEQFDLTKYEDIRNIEMSYLDSIKNMLKHTPVPLMDLAKITSTNAAKYIGIDEFKGVIQKGKDADLTILNENFDLVETLVNGKRVYINDHLL